ncbi:embryonic protein DC-8-like [Malania oleifera]|uniref:embryonic protein DC-8-like n=1 Tax=Malania oleifera TaxID=397392 RepID=UPI0025AEA5C7|nr:embryonic protein DC-8-like [Malania oleifera]
MGRTLMVVLWVVAAAAILQMCSSPVACHYGNANNYMENAKAGANMAADNVKRMADDATHSHSWADAGMNGQNTKDAAQNMMDAAGDAASKATDTITSAASETSKYASQKASEAANMASQKAEKAKNVASEKAEKAKEKVAGTVNYGMEMAASAMEETKQKYKAATEGASEEAKTKYEAAKEKASQTAGDMGDKMRKNAAEL